jgi:hypothetical protein
MLTEIAVGGNLVRMLPSVPSIQAGVATKFCNEYTPDPLMFSHVAVGNSLLCVLFSVQSIQAGAAEAIQHCMHA